MLSVYYLSNGSEKMLFYVCSVCGHFDFSPFANFPFRNNLLSVVMAKIPRNRTSDFINLKNSRTAKKCLFCGQENTVENIENHHPVNETGEYTNNTSFPTPTLINTVWGLFLKGKNPRRNYIGYLCMLCKRIYFDESFVTFQHSSSETQVDPNEYSLDLNNKMKKAIEFLKKVEKENNVSTEALNHYRDEVKVWKKLAINPPSFTNEPLETFGMFPTNIYLQENMEQKAKRDRVTVILYEQTKSNAKYLIETYGTEEQKASLRRNWR